MTTLVILSVVLALIIIAAVAAALIKVRMDLEATSADLATLAGALEMVESEHLKPLEPAVKAINGQFDVIIGAQAPPSGAAVNSLFPGIARKAKIVADRRPR
jgi:uncharacterized membrane protein